MMSEEHAAHIELDLLPPDHSPRPARSALTRTGGFLSGFTHTLQPYIGCRFGCEYCYVKGLSVHRFHRPGMKWGDYAHPRVGIDQQLCKELGRARKNGSLDALAIFMSSATDPYQGLERRWRLSRACLDVLLDFPPGLLILQTRSPLVEDDFDRLRRFGRRCWLNVTLETDREDVRRIATPYCPSIARRLQTLSRARDMGLNVQITVSPSLPYSDLEGFGRLLLQHGDRIVVDTYASGDGQGGSRTARTQIPDLYGREAWGPWRGEAAARALYEWLSARIGARAGWSQDGFTRLATEMAQNDDA